MMSNWPTLAQEILQTEHILLYVFEMVIINWNKVSVIKAYRVCKITINFHDCFIISVIVSGTLIDLSGMDFITSMVCYINGDMKTESTIPPAVFLPLMIHFNCNCTHNKQDLHLSFLINILDNVLLSPPQTTRNLPEWFKHQTEMVLMKEVSIQSQTMVLVIWVSIIEFT